MSLDLDPNHIFRDFVIDGMPASGANNPRKVDIRQWTTSMWQAVIALLADADPGLALPNLLIRYTVTGGTADAIVATPNLTLPVGPGLALFSIQIVQENTGPVTINGKPLRTNSNNEIADGGLVAGGIYLFLDVGSQFRLVSDQAGAAIVAAAEAARLAAEDAQAAAESAAGANLSNADSRAAAVVTNFPESVKHVRTAGYATPGDGGGGLYKRASSEPSHAGKFMSTDGTWWELAEHVVTPQMFGAKGDGLSDDTAAVKSAISIGLPIYWGNSTYRITETIALTLSAPIKWRSSGARLLVDTPSSVQYAFNINVNGQSVSIEGELRLNANKKAFTGWRFLNNTDTYVDFIAKDFGVYDVYRSSTAFTGGDGLMLDGAYRRVFLENFFAKDMVMAAGAGVSGTQGIFGATIKSTGPTRYPQSVTLINPYIENVYSEDSAYLFDQDGLRVMTAEDQVGVSQIYDSHLAVFGGSFINCANRSIKSQFEQGIVSGTRFVRDGVMLPQIQRGGQGPEIDFQVGGGIVKGIECRYRSSSPSSIVTFQGTRQSGKAVTGGEVSGLRLSNTGTNFFANLIVAISRDSLYQHIFIENVDMAANSPTSGPAILVNSQGGAVTFIKIDGMRVRCTSSIINCLGNGAAVRASGRDILHQGSSIPFATAGAGTSLTENLDGLNVAVAP